MIGIPLGLIYGNAAEWIVHKHILHGRGKSKKSFWNFHWHEHHRNARRDGMVDVDYHKTLLRWHAPGKELFALSMAAFAHLPLLPVAPFFTLTAYYCAFNYYRLHKKSHLNPQWTRKHLPWHYDHHMGPNQDANWCVTKPWFDIIMGTRVPYVGTQREKETRRRQARLQQNQKKNILHQTATAASY